jgi:hypothetical protein
MPRPTLAALLLLVALAGLAGAQETGALQVTCRPGVRVYLDGDFVGLTTADEDGLYLRGVAAGGHEVRLEKLGFEPMELEVEVRPGRATELRVGDLTPAGAATGAAPPPAPIVAPAATAPPAPTSAPPPAPAPSPAPATTAVPAALPVVASPPPPPAPVAPVVVAAPAERPPAPAPVATQPPTLVTTPPPAATPVAAVSTVVLSRSTRPASDVTFAYRASGAAAGEGRSIAIWRERGGPKAPVLVLTCNDSAGCEQLTSPRFPPGAYRFRVVFSRTQGEGSKAVVLFRHEVSVEVETKSDTAYLVEAVFGADDPARCTATVREAVFAPAPSP